MGADPVKHSSIRVIDLGGNRGPLSPPLSLLPTVYLSLSHSNNSLMLPLGVMGADPVKQSSIRLIDLGGNRGARGLAYNGVQGGSLIDQVRLAD